MSETQYSNQVVLFFGRAFDLAFGEANAKLKGRRNGYVHQSRFSLVEPSLVKPRSFITPTHWLEPTPIVSESYNRCSDGGRYGNLNAPSLTSEVVSSASSSENKLTMTQILDMCIRGSMVLIMGASFIFIISKSSASQANKFTKNRARNVSSADVNVTFDDVAGQDEAKREVLEIVDFLERPEKYTAVGAKIPRGVLLVGPSGTGKTLLARATAGKAGVPFFSCSASEFVEMFVGVGAARIRELFKEAKEKAPCIVFVDELDAVGKTRGMPNPGGGSNDEREQTVNQLLTEMDGFSGNTGVIVMAATNRADVLDPALLRPGRFDRQIIVERPDLGGRVGIMQVHTRNKPLDVSVSIEDIARCTAGFSGADLENLCNEAAIHAARHGRTSITSDDFDAALERIQMGLARPGQAISAKRRRLVAVHEAGHALAAVRMQEFDMVKKVSIVPRGASGGATYFLPSPDRADGDMVSLQHLEDQLVVALAGRVAEELTFGKGHVTTGASSDLSRVYEIARAMVTRFGFSDAMGPVAWSSSSAEATARAVDVEVSKIASIAYERCTSILKQDRELLDAIAAALQDRETITGEELMDIIATFSISRKSI